MHYPFELNSTHSFIHSFIHTCIDSLLICLNSLKSLSPWIDIYCWIELFDPCLSADANNIDVRIELLWSNSSIPVRPQSSLHPSSPSTNRSLFNTDSHTWSALTPYSWCFNFNVVCCLFVVCYLLFVCCLFVVLFVVCLLFTFVFFILLIFLHVLLQINPIMLPF